MASITDILALAPQARALKTAAALKGAELTYPTLPAEFTYPVIYSRYGAGAPASQGDLAYILAQDLDEHNAATQAGVEDTVASWWPAKDIQPRGGAAPVSSAVSDVKIMPDNSVVVRFGNKGKFYTYKRATDPRQASEMVAELMSNPAGMGRAIAKGTKRHFSKGDGGVPDPAVGAWSKGF